MIEVTDNIHRILAPRLVTTIENVDKNGRTNIIPINNITAISTEPSMVIIAITENQLACVLIVVAKMLDI